MSELDMWCLSSPTKSILDKVNKNMDDQEERHFIEHGFLKWCIYFMEWIITYFIVYENIGVQKTNNLSFLQMNLIENLVCGTIFSNQFYRNCVSLWKVTRKTNRNQFKHLLICYTPHGMMPLYLDIIYV